MRARAQVRHLVLPADQAYGTAEVRSRVASWLDANPGFRPPQEGPDRVHWERLTRRPDIRS